MRSQLLFVDLDVLVRVAVVDDATVVLLFECGREMKVDCADVFDHSVATLCFVSAVGATERGR